MGGVLTYADLQLFVNVLPAMLDAARDFQTWKVFKNLQLLQRLLRTI